MVPNIVIKKNGVADEFERLIEYGIDLDNRTVYLDGDIDEETEIVIKGLNYLNRKGNEEVTLVISSDGGCMDTMFALYDCLINSPSPIRTIGTGVVASAATLILACGDTRYATENCWVMTHQASAFLEGDEDHVAAQTLSFQHSTHRYWNMLARHTKKGVGAWKSKSKKLGEHWLIGEPLVNWGVVDGIIKSPRRDLPPLPKFVQKRVVVEEEDDE